MLFCDLVGSMALAEAIDDETYRDIIRRYYDACEECVARYEGHVANYLGDGLLAYFGYPTAHEDDAERAIRAALDALASLSGLRNVHTADANLEVRIGIHSGPVVVGDLGGGQHREAMALGETVNLAARLQSVAEPGTVVVSEATRRLVRGVFVFERLGSRRLKGVTRLVETFRAVKPSGVQHRLDLVEGSLTPFVGRQAELAVLEDSWERTQERNGQAVLITGDAGVGKSRLARVLRERLADQMHAWIECRCSPYTQHTVFHAAASLVAQILRFDVSDTAADKMARLRSSVERAGLPPSDAVPLFAELLAIPVTEGRRTFEGGPDQQRRRTIEWLTAWTLAQAEPHPAVVAVEDMHWCDPSSLEFLGRLVEQSTPARLMLLMTTRPGFVPPWTARAAVRPIRLDRLTAKQARDMVVVLCSEELPRALTELIVTQADGVPLYIEELARTLVDSDRLARRNGRLELTAPIRELAIPETLHDSLLARLDRLGPAKDVAQRAAVLGREFTDSLLQAVCDAPVDTVQAQLEQLVGADVLHVRRAPLGSMYGFRHALVQAAAYDSLLRARRQELHRRAADALRTRFPDIAAAEPALLAHHYTEGGDALGAVGSWLAAGQQAMRQGAHAEAATHFRKGLDAVRAHPDPEATAQQELLLQAFLGQTIWAMRSYASSEATRAFMRARTLATATGADGHLARVLLGLWVSSLMRCAWTETRALVDEIRDLATRLDRPSLWLWADLVHGLTHIERGEPAAAVPSLRRAFSRYDERRDHGEAWDPGVMALAYTGRALVTMGRDRESMQCATSALELARRLGNPYDIVSANVWAGSIAVVRGDPGVVAAHAEEVLELSTTYGFALRRIEGLLMRGWGIAQQGDPPAGAALIREGLGLLDETEVRLGLDYNTGLLIEALAAANRIDESIELLSPLVDSRSDHLRDRANLLRVLGGLMQRRGDDPARVESAYRRALMVARERGACLYELRAATALGHLLRSEGREAELRDVLAPVCQLEVDGFATQYLAEARKLLDEPR